MRYTESGVRTRPSSPSSPMAATEDDDQSISDDDEFGSNVGGLQCLCRGNREDQISALSQLEMLQGGSSSSACRYNPNNYDQLVVHSSMEYNMDSYEWSHAFKEVKELDLLHEQRLNPGSQKVQKCKGGKARAKFAIRVQSHKGPHSQPLSLDNIFEDSLNAANPQLVDSFEMGEEHPKVQLSDHLAGTDKIASKASQQVIEILEAVDKGAECSMVELLDELCRKKGRPSEKNSSIRSECSSFNGVKVQNLLGCRNLDDEDPLLSLDSSTSNEDENQLLHLDNMDVSCLETPKIRGRTMLEQFHEAFSSANADTSLTQFPISEVMRNNYYQRLQQVVQREKNQHSSFQKLLQTRSSDPVESRCIVVRILSQCLDAKLTICDCLVAKCSESLLLGNRSPESVDNEECWQSKIIFSSTVCNDVEFEEGNLVQIYPPWKEVQVSKEQKVLLCNYFSPVRT